MNHTTKHELSVLITDDIAQNRSYFADILREISPNLSIDEAENGREAVNKVSTHINQTGRSYDLIIMDFKMPELNGADATKAIRQLESKHSPQHHSAIFTWSTALNSPYKEADDWLPKVTNSTDVKAKLLLFDLLPGG